jgi:UDP-N-acetylglucosamine enolpyruvyl transferase
VNHHQRKVLHAIFAHPLNANLEIKDIVGVLNGLGAEIDAKSKSRLGVTLNGHTTVLHLTSHSLLKADVMQIRKFLESCGITAEAYPV